MPKDYSERKEEEIFLRLKEIIPQLPNDLLYLVARFRGYDFQRHFVELWSLFSDQQSKNTLIRDSKKQSRRTHRRRRRARR